MRTFVVGDIHGAYRAFMQCLERSAFDYVGDHQTATNSNHVAVMEATTLGRLMVLKDALSPYFSP